LATRRKGDAKAPAGIMIPLYTYPTDGTWAAVIRAKNAHPSLPFVAIMNPNSGPGASRDASYATGVKDLRAAGVVVLGYVTTGYATKSYSEISNLEAQVSAYHEWYRVDGIFFDEMSNVAGYESYYAALDSYVRSLGMKHTAGNPASTVPNSYVGTLDTLVAYENAGLPDLSALANPGRDAKDFAILAYGVASLSRSFLKRSPGVAAWIYLTDGVLPNPYKSLPAYFEDEVATLDLNQARACDAPRDPEPV
jgi:hypothetical protein